MIAFVVVRSSPINRVTSGQIRPRTTTNDRERGQLQPQLQPPAAARAAPGHYAQGRKADPSGMAMEPARPGAE
jgi:hypothetical protein